MRDFLYCLYCLYCPRSSIYSLYSFTLSLFEGIVFPSVGPSLGPPSTVLVASREKPPFKHAQLAPEYIQNLVKWDLWAFLRQFRAVKGMAIYD